MPRPVDEGRVLLRVEMGIVRRQAASWTLQLSKPAYLAPKAWMAAAGAALRPPPDSEIAALISLGACGSVLTMKVLSAPADWPKRRTCFGSPPKAPMLSCIHWRPRSMSWMAWFP